MKDTHVSRCYAQALFNVALSRSTVDIISSEITQLKSFNDKDARFGNFLDAPQVLTEHKIAMVKALFTTRLSPSLLSFLLLLIEKGRVDHLGEIAREFEKLVRTHKGLIRARVTTAVFLDEVYKKRLRDRLENLTGKKVEILYKIDHSIIGGIIVQLEHKVIDRSVRNVLDNLRHELLAVKVY